MKKNIFILSVFSFFIVISFQNCAEVQYIEGLNFNLNSTPDSEILGEEGSPRTLVLNPIPRTQKIVAPLKILLVIDNSYSMIHNNLKLKESLLSLIKPIRHLPIEIKLITTDVLSQTQDIEAQGWSKKVTNIGPSTMASDFLKNKFLKNETEVFVSGYDVFFYLNNKDRFQLNPSDEDYENKVLTLQNRIAEIASSYTGSDREQAFCNTLLALYDQGPHRFFNPGDKAAILVLTDEEDNSRWHPGGTKEYRRDCRNRYTYGQIADTALPKQFNATYNLEIFSIKFNISYERSNDGNWVKATAGDNGGLPVSPSDFPQLVGGTKNRVLPCSIENEKKALDYAKYLVGGPLTQKIKVENCEVRSTWTALYNFNNLGETSNRCSSSFNHNGQSYLNMEDYLKRVKNRILVQGTCHQSLKESYKQRSFSDFYIDGADDPEILNAGLLNLNQHRLSIQKAILNKAMNLFGESEIVFASIIHKTEACIKNPIQTIGQSFMNFGIGHVLRERVFSYSICDEDYKPILSHISNQISTETLSELLINLTHESEKISTVHLKRGEERHLLELDKDYKVEKRTDSKQIELNLINLKIKEGDEIEILLVK